MLKRPLLLALVLFSFINSFAYARGWFDFFILRENPDDALRAIANQWMQERRQLEVGTSDGRSREVIENPLDIQNVDRNPIADFEHIRRFVGWQAFLREVDAIMAMDLEGEDQARRAYLLGELIQAFCAQMGCDRFPLQQARAGGLEAELLQRLRSEDVNWASIRGSVERLIEVYRAYVGQCFGGFDLPIGYRDCIVRLLAQQSLTPAVERLQGEEGEAMPLGEAMARNFAVQTIVFLRELFQEDAPLNGHYMDLGDVDFDAVLAGQGNIVLQIRRALALNAIEQTQAMLSARNGGIHVEVEDDHAKKDDKSKKDDKRGDDEDEELNEEKGDKKKEDEQQDDDEVEAVDEETQARNVVDAYIAWVGLGAELEAVFDLALDEGDGERDGLARRLVEYWEVEPHGGLPVEVQQQVGGVLARLRGHDLLDVVWPEIQPLIRELQASLLAILESIFNEPINRLLLAQHLTETLIQPAVAALWEHEEGTLEQLLQLNLRGQQLEAVRRLLERYELLNLLEQGVQMKFLTARARLLRQNSLAIWRERALVFVGEALERLRLQREEAEVEEVEVVRNIVGGDGLYFEQLGVPAEMWCNILEILFQTGSQADVIRFISTSLYLHGLALCPRYERIPNVDGSYTEVTTTRNIFTEFGHRCIQAGRYEDAFRYFAYMGCFQLLLEENFSGMLEVIWQINEDGLRSIRINDLFGIERSVGEGNAWPVCRAINLHRSPVVLLGERMYAREVLIERVFNLIQVSQNAHDTVANAELPIERRTAVLARLQALLRHQRDQDIPVEHIWEIHEVVFTEGFSMDQVRGVIDTLKRLCIARMHSKRKMDVNMVYSIVTNLVHLAESLAPVPVEESRRLYALQALREIMQELPVRYFKVYRQRFQNIVNEAPIGHFIFAEEGQVDIYTLAQEILNLMHHRQYPPKIIEVTEDDD